MAYKFEGFERRFGGVVIDVECSFWGWVIHCSLEEVSVVAAW